VTVLDLALQIVLGALFTAWVVRRDMRGLPPERLARSWNVASFWSAVVGFGPLSIPVHFARTRRTLLGFLLGVAWAAGVIVVLGIVSDLVASVGEALGR
jgi:hypothetical protein